MEKGFDDNELADIMSEIESLEKEFTEEGGAETTENIETQASGADAEAQEEQKSAEDDVQRSRDDDSFFISKEEEEVLGELAKMPVEDVAGPDKEAHRHEEQFEAQENLHHLQDRREDEVRHVEKNHTAMSFHVEGDMRFELSFHIAGKFVGLTVTEEGLEIGLDGGMKFIVPVEKPFSGKKAS